jgi:hypothetical protein
MFHVSGDHNPRHNIPDAPQLLFPVGIFFLVGLGLSVAGLRRSANAWFLPLWIGVMLLPELLSVEGIPHSLRAIGVLPAVMLLAAAGYDWLARKWGTTVLSWTSVLILVAIGATEAYRYFGVWAKDPLTGAAFSQSYVAAAAYLNALPTDAPRYVMVSTSGKLMPHRNPDGTIVLLPLAAQAVIFQTMGHPQAFYFLPGDSRVAIPEGVQVINLE